MYDQSSTAELNAAATRLTTNLRDGLEVQARRLLLALSDGVAAAAAAQACIPFARNTPPQICGDALAFYAHPGADLGEFEWQQLE